MARPKKKEEERRSGMLNARLTQRERAKIEGKAAAFGMTASEFMRRRALRYRLPPTAAKAYSEAVTATALMRLGVNLNQIAKHMNAGRRAPEDDLNNLIDRINLAMDAIYDPGLRGRREQL
jgi:hypothetical protein